MPHNIFRYSLSAGAALTLNLCAVSQSVAQTAPPPPAEQKTKTEEAVGALSKVNTATGLIFDTAISAGPSTPDVLNPASKVSDGFGALGLAFTASEMTANIYRGDTPAVLEQSQELLIDAGVASMCAGAGPGAIPCGAAYGLGKLAGQAFSYGVRESTGQDIGAHVYDGYEWLKHKAAPDTDPSNEAYWERLRNEHEARVQAGATSGSTCHPGHDENAHPGGCNLPRLP